ncbi:MAG: glycosyltransferase family 1 protein, partial [Mesorhizobium sp.]
MKQDGHETFEEMVGPAGSPLRRVRLLATNRANRTRTKVKAWLRTRFPFVLPARGPLSDLDGGIDIPVHIF